MVMSFFRSERFLPLFKTQFLGAFNDNMLKNAVLVLITYQLVLGPGYNVPMLDSLAGNLLTVPFLFFSAMAGDVADKFDKARVARWIKLAEMGIMVAAAAGFWMGSVPVLLAALLFMGVHSTFFGPVKLSLLPRLLRDDELMAGNSYVEAGTFLSILLGTMAGGLLILAPEGGIVVSVALMGVAVAGYLAARRIPAAPALEAGLSINWNIFSETLRILDYAQRDARIFLCILAICWFWFVGSIFVLEVPAFTKIVLHAQAPVFTLLLITFSVGIGLGCLLANRLQRGLIHLTYVPVAALAMTVFGVDLFFASGHGVWHGPGLLSLGAFLRTGTCWRVVFDFLMLSVAAGVYVVPLYVMIQHQGAPGHLARLIAANNFLNAVFMVGSSAVTVGLLWIGFSIPGIFLAIAIVNSFVAVFMCRLLPGGFFGSVARFRARVLGR